MNQQQRADYIQRREEVVYGRRGSTMDAAPPALPTASAEVDLGKQWEQRQRRKPVGNVTKIVLWLVTWFAMLCLCQKTAEAIGGHYVTSITAALEALGTLAMLAITFWRFVLRVMWCCIGLVIVLAIIKGAFLVVFAL
ncbi:hypothetical protein [Paraburkholderia youngii]|uniref:hypothetical protein n=1 Tax=Paraburkholderia youngii TaxID=2782701 RepID=UPI003D2260BC